MDTGTFESRPSHGSLVARLVALTLACLVAGGCGSSSGHAPPADAGADQTAPPADAGADQTAPPADAGADADGSSGADADGSSGADADGAIVDACSPAPIAAPAIGTTYDFSPTDPKWIADPYSTGSASTQFSDGNFFCAGARKVWARESSTDRIKYYPDVPLGAGTYTWATYVPVPGGAPGSGDSVSFANFVYDAGTGSAELDFECGWGDGSGQWRMHVPGITSTQLVCGMSAQALNPVTQCWAAIDTDRWNKFTLALTTGGAGTLMATWKINGKTVCGPLDTTYPSSTTTFHATASVENLTWMGAVSPPANTNYAYWDWFNFSP